MQKDMHLLYDILYYFVVPILFWKLGRDYFSDYLIIVFSSIPGIFYSIYRFVKSSELNFTRMFLLANIVAGLAIDILSRSAIQLLWCDVFYSIGLCLLYLLSCLIKKPIFSYFSLDIFVIQGYDRALTKELFLEKAAFKVLLSITLMNGIRELLYALFLIKFLKKYGVEAYSISIFLDQFFGLVMSGFSIVGFMYLYRLTNQIVSVKAGNHLTRRRSIKLSMNWYQFHFENSCFFFWNHHH